MAKHQSLILTFTQDAFEVNEIYEKMIVAEREISKLEHLNKLVGESLYFEKYSLEVERNREIERHMLTRK